jgi:cold shock CspA family protein/tetratricopeptide (TPR) repeat protein
MGLEQVWLDRLRLYYLIGALETDLRRIIAQWVQPFQEPEILYGAVLPTLEARRRADGQNSHSSDLLDYLDFADAYQLINRFREMVPPEVASALRTFTPQLEPLVQPRNRVMHFRTLSPGDSESVARFCSEFLATRLDLPELRTAVRRLSADADWVPDITPPSRPDAVANNVPLPEFDETGLLGRREETERLLGLLLRRSDRVITLVGEGGIGKTALAVKVLDDYLHHPECPVAVTLWTSLKTERLTGSGVQQIVGAARDVLSDLDDWLTLVGEEPDAELDALCEVLDGLPALIVIDNLETVSATEVIQFFDRLPRDTNLLLTSRVGLGQLERRVELGPLSERDGGLLLRRFAETRGVSQLARQTPDQLSGQAARLRLNPLAIRWYVEAIAAGGSPEALLANQRGFLQFCLQTIYDDLSEISRQFLTVLHVADGSLDVAELCLMTGLTSDEARRSLHELGRRSLVITDFIGELGTHEVFDVSSSASLYLSSVSRPDDTLVGQVQDRARELRESRERQAVRAAANPLSPYVFGDSTDHEAVVHMLGEALRLNRSSKPDEAMVVLTRAEELDPEYYEVARARAFVSSRIRPSLATENYRRALALAPDDEAHARVAYFFAEHLASVERDIEAAEQLARIAHDRFGSPVTAGRLGRVLTYRQQWEEAEPLVRFAATDDDTRGAIIARTQLVNLGKRRLEHRSRYELPEAAIRDAASLIDETQAYLATGRVDSRLVEELVHLSCEVVGAAARISQLGAVDRSVLTAVLALRSRSSVLATSSRRDHAQRALYAVSEREDCPPTLRTATTDCLTALGATSHGAYGVGRVKVFSRSKGFGFIRVDDGNEVFFHASAVPDANNQILLTPYAAVQFTTTEDGQGRPRAEDVNPVDWERGSLIQRRARIQSVRDGYCIAEDDDTGVSVLVHRSAFPQAASFDAVEVSDVIRANYELTDRGPRAANESAQIVHSAPSEVQRRTGRR